MGRNQIINLLAILLFIASNAYGLDAKGKATGQSVLDKYGSKDGFTNNISNPLISGTTMTTVDGGTSFNAKISCPSSEKFLTVLFVPEAGGEITITYGQDVNLDNTPDYSASVTGVSGVCANGVIKCDSGTWTNCQYYVWQADSNTKYVNLAQVSSMSSMGGCYCINNSCGTSLALMNSSKILGDIGGAISGALLSVDPKYAISDTVVDSTSAVFYGQSVGECSSNGTTSSSSYDYNSFYNDSSAMDTATQNATALQSADSESMYNLLSNSAAAKSVSTATCQKTVTGSVSSSTELIYATCSGYILSYYQSCDSNLKYYQIQSGTIVDSSDTCQSCYGGLCGTKDSMAPTTTSTVPDGATLEGNYGTNCQVIPGQNFADDDTSYTKWDVYSRYEGKIITDTIYLNETDQCQTLVDAGCTLKDETVDGVQTYKDYIKVTDTPETCKDLTGQVKIYNICGQWEIQRTYVCDITSTTTFDLTDTKTRLKSIDTTLTDNVSSMTYTDTTKKDGTWSNQSYTISLSGRDEVFQKCTQGCEVRKPTINTQATLSGTTSTLKSDTTAWEISGRACKENNGTWSCPVDTAAGEELVNDCQCLTNFEEAATVMSVLDDAADDIICSQ